MMMLEVICRLGDVFEGLHRMFLLYLGSAANFLPLLLVLFYLNS